MITNQKVGGSIPSTPAKEKKMYSKAYKNDSCTCGDKDRGCVECTCEDCGVWLMSDEETKCFDCIELEEIDEDC